MPSKFTNYNSGPALKEFPVKGSPADKVKNFVIDKVSDVMSYPARRAAQKSMLEGETKYKELKEANQSKQMMQRKALKTVTTPKNSQRDSYEIAMNRAMAKGGSNGIGVGK